MHTLYQIADAEIRSCISDYLILAADTNGFTAVASEFLDTERKVAILLAGLNAPSGIVSANKAVQEWERRRAVPFDVEAGITAGVYTNIRQAGIRYLNEVKAGTKNFTEWKPEFIRANPHTLPLLQRLAGFTSKAALKKRIGGVSDNTISLPAAKRLAEVLTACVIATDVRDAEILMGLEVTLEGIVRDLIGRVMLESIVESALLKAGVPFKREAEYDRLSGVVYDFRADFIVPDEISPKAFIEVRKSSSRHASLYAKDKMFSAINWKGKHQAMLAVLIVDGEWTAETLRVMARVFDYVVPLQHVNSLSEAVSEYLDGDTTKLKWLIDFKITPAN
jgi:hypothetical protein